MPRRITPHAVKHWHHNQLHQGDTSMHIKTGLKHRLATLAAAALTLSAGLASPAAQAGYPEHPINMVVSYGPGGGTDLIARALAPFIEKYLGNGAQIVVLNRPGAGGAIGRSEE